MYTWLCRPSTLKNVWRTNFTYLTSRPARVPSPTLPHQPSCKLYFHNLLYSGETHTHFYARGEIYDYLAQGQGGNWSLIQWPLIQTIPSCSELTASQVIRVSSGNTDTHMYLQMAALNCFQEERANLLAISDVLKRHSPRVNLSSGIAITIATTMP